MRKSHTRVEAESEFELATGRPEDGEGFAEPPAAHPGATLALWPQAGFGE